MKLKLKFSDFPPDRARSSNKICLFKLLSHSSILNYYVIDPFPFKISNDAIDISATVCARTHIHTYTPITYTKSTLNRFACCMAWNNIRIGQFLFISLLILNTENNTICLYTENFFHELKFIIRQENHTMNNTLELCQCANFSPQQQQNG